MATAKKKAKPMNQNMPTTPAIDVPGRSEGQTITYAERGHQTMVRKSNQLVQMAMYNLTTQQQKIMLHIFAMIQPTDEELPRYVFRVSDFCKMCNIDPHSGHLYKQIKEDLLALKNSNSAFINIPGTEIDHAFDWLHTVDINRATKEIYITLDPVLKPHLIQLKSLYTTLDLTYTMSMRSQYSIRIYELCKSYQNLYQANKKNGMPLIWDTEKLRQQIACPYTSFNDLDRWALKKAKKEIAQFTDILFDYEIYTRGAHGKVSEISVTIEPKSPEQVEMVLNDIAKRMKKSRRLSKQELLAEEKAFDEALDAERAEEAEEAEEEGMSLGYVSAPDTTIVYSVAQNRDEMLRELALRADYEKLTGELNEAEQAALDILIQTMADMAADASGGQEMKDGGNKEFFLAMNDVIYNSRGEHRLYPWFKAVVPRYAKEVLPLAQAKPIRYLYKCVLNDLKNYRVLLLEPLHAALPEKTKPEPVLELEARETDTPFLTETDAATEKTMLEAIRRRLEMGKAEALSDGRREAYETAVRYAATLCRRNDPAKDAGYVVNGCNTKYLNLLNRCIAEDKLTALFLAIAEKLDMDAEMPRIKAMPSIRDPQAFYFAELEKCIASPEVTIKSGGKRPAASGADNRAVTRSEEERAGQEDIFAQLERRPRRLKRQE